MANLTVTTAAGVRIVGTESGVGVGRPLVLLHALGEQGGDWDGIVRERFDRRFRTIALDLRGHGRSDWPGDYSVDLMSRDVAEVLDLRGVADAVVVGHSLGGAVGFDLAVRRPDLVAALVAEDVAPPEGGAPRPAPAKPAEDLPFDWDVVVSIRAEVDAGAPGLWDALPELRAPTLIVAGGPSSTVDQERLADAARRLPSGTVRTLESGHYVHRARPQEFTDLVLDWLTEQGL